MIYWGLNLFSSCCLKCFVVNSSEFHHCSCHGHLYVSCLSFLYPKSHSHLRVSPIGTAILHLRFCTLIRFLFCYAMSILLDSSHQIYKLFGFALCPWITIHILYFLSLVFVRTLLGNRCMACLSDLYFSSNTLGRNILCLFFRLLPKL